MRLGRGFTAVARQVPRLAGLAGLCPAPLTARYARRALGGACDLAGVLPPWHNECHDSPVWQGFALRPSLRAMRAGHSGDMRLGRGFTAVAQRVPRLAGLAGLCPAPTSARIARRLLADMRLGLVLPPWHDGCHGSPVWQGELPLDPRQPPHVLQNAATFSRSHASYKGRNCRFSSGFPSESRFCS